MVSRTVAQGSGGVKAACRPLKVMGKKRGCRLFGTPPTSPPYTLTNTHHLRPPLTHSQTQRALEPDKTLKQLSSYFTIFFNPAYCMWRVHAAVSALMRLYISRWSECFFFTGEPYLMSGLRCLLHCSRQSFLVLVWCSITHTVPTSFTTT